MKKMIVPKNDMSLFATKKEVDYQVLELTNRLVAAMERFEQLRSEMCAFVEKYNEGVITLNETHREFAQTILGLKNEIEQMKEQD